MNFGAISNTLNYSKKEGEEGEEEEMNWLKYNRLHMKRSITFIACDFLTTIMQRFLKFLLERNFYPFCPLAARNIYTAWAIAIVIDCW